MGSVTDIKEPTKAAPAGDEFDGFDKKTVEIRGKEYTFRELSTTEYDDAVKKSTHDGMTDTVQLLRWMIIVGSVDPKLDAGSVGKLPFGVLGDISTAVNDLHFHDQASLQPLADRLADAGWTVTAPGEEAPKDDS